jgi:SPP1 gp7 family putative phage head morphogenesis protein
MHTLDITEITRRTFRLSPRAPAVMRAIGPNLSTQIQIERAVTAVLRSAAVICRDDVLPAVAGAKAELAAIDAAGLTKDTVTRLQRELDRFRQFLEGHGVEITPKISRLLREEEVKHRKAFVSALKSASAIDADAVLSAGDVAAQVRVAAEASASLIKGLTDDLAKRVASLVLDSARKGTRSATLAKDLQKQFKFSNKRAKLIARDQLASFNASLNKARQKQVGVKKYIWSTSMDERVRGNPSGKYPEAKPSHWAREGKTYSWSKPPVDGHPGEPINCRCVARAVIE